ncbi:MAG: F0F1 ATP synthase subunit B [Methyloligellaceae bacterium]
MIHYFADPTVWVAITVIIFALLMYYVGVPKKIGDSLDNKAGEIRSELEQARQLREEAQAILAEYQRKQREAEQTADDIVAQAKKEAEAFATETRQALKASLERRTLQAEEKIARAQEQATNEVRLAAINVAVSATEKLISENLSDKDANNLIKKSIQDLNGKLN